MAQVAVTINGRSYTVTCENGKEDHVARLADYLNGKVGELTKGLGQVGDTRLLVMAGLLIADELSESLVELNVQRGVGPAPGDPGVLSSRIETAASKIEAIVARLERP